MPTRTELDPGKAREVLEVLKTRFEANPRRHRGLAWEAVEARLAACPAKLLVLRAMEETGGEPDVIGFDPTTGEYLFCDCSPESPTGRRSLCYDRAALDSRKEAKPRDSALDLARAMGVEVLDEAGYRQLQELQAVDLKTSSWLQTDAKTRSLGGAVFGDRRYDRVFVYHNGADSYYAARGFRGTVKV